jgi:hypothetical protein
MTTMDNRVGEGQGGVAATYCIDSRLVLCCLVPVNSNEDATASRASYSHVRKWRRYTPYTVGTTALPSTNLD